MRKSERSGTLNVNTNKPKTIACPECHGLGSLPSGDGFDEPCRECGGSGVVYDESEEELNPIFADNEHAT